MKKFLILGYFCITSFIATFITGIPAYAIQLGDWSFSLPGAGGYSAPLPAATIGVGLFEFSIDLTLTAGDVSVAPQQVTWTASSPGFGTTVANLTDATGTRWFGAGAEFSDGSKVFSGAAKESVVGVALAG
jgi:hypothetical protein